MASDISVKMAVEGEASFNSAIKAANSQIKALDAELKNVASSFDDTNSAEEKAAAQMEVLSQKADVQREKLEVLNQQHETAKARLDELGTALEQARAEFGENSVEATKAATAYNRQAAEVAKLEQQMSTTSASLNETTRAMDELGNEADDAGGQLSIFGQVLSAELVATAAIDGAKKLAGALKDIASDVIDYGNEVDKMSQKMGMSAQGYQEWDQVMQHCDISMSTLKTSMKTLATAAETGNEAFGKLGISQRELSELDQEGLFNRTIEALLQVEDTTERTYLAGKLLGRGATELGPLLNKSADEIQAMKDRAHELGAVMSDEAVKASADFKDAQQDLGAAIQGLTYEALVPSIEKITEWANALSDGIAKARGAMNEPMTEDKQAEIARSLSDQADAYARMVESGEKLSGMQIMEMETLFGSGSREWLDAMAQSLSDAATGIEEFGGAAGGTFGEVAAAETAVADGAEQAAGAEKKLTEENKAALDAAKAAAEAYQQLCDDLSGMPEILSMTGMSVTELADLLTGAGMSADQFRSGVESMRDGIVNSFQEMSEGSKITAEEMITNLQNNLARQQEWSGNMRTLWAQSFGDEGMGGTVRAFLNYLAQQGPEYANVVAEFANGGYDKLVEAAQKWNDAGQQSGQDYADGVAMSNYVAQEAGAELVGEAASGMADSTEVADAGETAANAAVDSFEGVDGTPSGEKKSGEFAAGITNATDQVESAAEDAANAACEAFDSVDGVPSGEALSEEFATGIGNKAGDVGDAAEAAANDAKEQAKVDTSPVGEYFSQGLAAGIRAGRSGVIRAAIEVMKAAVQAAQDAGKIASPSKVMRDEVGVFLTEGIAAGMLDPGALNSLEEAADVITERIAGLFGVNLAGEDSEAIAQVKAWKDAWEGALDDTIRNAEHSIFLMEKRGAGSSEIAKVYKDLQEQLHRQAEQARAMGLSDNDKYIQDLQKKWWGYEDEIRSLLEEETDLRDEAAEKAVEAYQNAFNEIQKAQESMQDKLAGYGSVYEAGQSGQQLLNQIHGQVREIENYGRALEKIRGRYYTTL